MQNHRLHLKVKGNLQDPFYKWYTKGKVKKLGLKTHALNHYEAGHIEFIVEGGRTELESLIHWAKSGPVFSRVEEVRFKFKDY